MGAEKFWAKCSASVPPLLKEMTGPKASLSLKPRRFSFPRSQDYPAAPEHAEYAPRDLPLVANEDVGGCPYTQGREYLVDLVLEELCSPFAEGLLEDRLRLLH